MNIKNLLCLVSAVALCASAAAQTQHMSLPELAKAEKARRAKLQKASGPARVYTEGERSDTSSDATTTESSAPSRGAAPAATGSKKKEKTSDELAADKQKEWAEKVTETIERNRIRRNQISYPNVGLPEEINKPGFNDSSWKLVNLLDEVNHFENVVWLRKKIIIPKL
ncbi:MAG: hypothetical protein ABI565_09325, partial [Vicinamibacteria bacterium]